MDYDDVRNNANDCQDLFCVRSSVNSHQILHIFAMIVSCNIKRTCHMFVFICCLEESVRKQNCAVCLLRVSVNVTTDNHLLFEYLFSMSSSRYLSVILLPSCLEPEYIESFGMVVHWHYCTCSIMLEPSHMLLPRLVRKSDCSGCLCLP